LAAAEADLAAGMRWENQQADACVDWYFRAAIEAWQWLESAACPSGDDPEYRSAWRVYQQSVARLIPAANRFGRLDPRAGLVVVDRGGRRVIPVKHHGFAWQASDFCQVLPAADFQDGKLAKHYRVSGLGIALVAVRHACGQQHFFRAHQPFAVTAVVRSSGSGAVLDFYNPNQFDSLPLGGSMVRLERDLTAPFAYLAKESSRFYIEGFLDPADSEVRPQLLMMEPYQRGKIPVVFIHGLLSDPTTWLDTVNELRAHPGFCRQYQVWYFRYPTGSPILESAAALREQLVETREQFDPGHRDGAMTRMVLVGHSMGGLVAKLQVTYSYDIMWRHVAKQPLEAVRTDPAMRERLERNFFFDPSPLVTRVVFIATPHHGSTMARRVVGRIASSVVSPFGTNEPRYQRLMEENSDIFYEYLQKSAPTSVDLLEPANPMLDALEQMPYRPCVRRHSIIGNGGGLLGGEPSDGVVPVPSARQRCVCSELYVRARHTQIHHEPETIAELGRILTEHAQQAGCTSPSMAAERNNGYLALESR
jgi:pimeloyl-ACP methyl ester carboxylesterase